MAQGCLQPLVMLALVLLAARAAALPALLQRLLVLTALVDFTLGSVLHLLILHRDYTARWLRGEPYARLAADENVNMRLNIQYKLLHDVDFFGDRIQPQVPLVVGLLVLLLALSALKWWQARRVETATAAD